MILQSRAVYCDSRKHLKKISLYVKYYIPGQLGSVQLVTSSASPRFNCSHVFPPNNGDGFVHVRQRVREPVPHVTEQFVQDDHWLKFPSRGLTEQSEIKANTILKSQKGITFKGESLKKVDKIVLKIPFRFIQILYILSYKIPIYKLYYQSAQQLNWTI